VPNKRLINATLSIFAALSSLPMPLVSKSWIPKPKNTQEEIVEVLNQIRKVIEVQRCPLKGRTFKLPNVSDEEIKDASCYIAIEEGDMIYFPSDQCFFPSNALMLSANRRQLRVRHQDCCN
jgi:hypothetical protein